jgi:hypothetical protein
MKVLIAALLAAALSGCAAAPVSAGALVDVSVINRTTGQPVPTHYHQGNLYIAGTPGERYAIRIANRTGRRVMAVVSVDGVNVVSGETAATGQGGYVLAAHQSFEINGWRKSLDEVAAFYFTALPDSYAARTGRPQNVGVIGVAVFREWQPPRPAAAVASPPGPFGPARGANAQSRADAGNGPDTGAPSATPEESGAADAAERAAPAMKRQEKLGTGHGEREWSAARYTSFRRATEHPNQTVSIHYDSTRNLVARGIIPQQPPVDEPYPVPFPGGGFVPDPRG